MAGVRAVAYGRPATLALAEAIAEAKDGDPLAPVTVVVSSNLAGLSARRLLGSGVGGGNGIANVQFVTPFRLAELLAAGAEDPRRPLTTAVLGAAVRRVLADHSGEFAPVAHHPATEAALVATYGELSRALDGTLDAIAGGSSHGSEVVRIFRSTREVLAGYIGEDELMAVASERAHDDEVVHQLGPVLWFLPERVTPAVAALLRTIKSVAGLTVVVGLTGDVAADDVLRSSVARVVEAEVPRSVDQPPAADRILSVSDADEEVRAVVREIAVLAESGVALDRVGVFVPEPDPYLATLAEQFDAAGIAFNGPGRQRLGDSMAGRVLLAALGLIDDDFGRAAVLALVSGAPVVHDGEWVPASWWEDVSRRAGVVGGVADWDRKLLVAAEAWRDEAEHTVEISDGRRRHLRADADAADALRSFVALLAADLEAVGSALTWPHRVSALLALTTRLLGSEHRRTRWPEQEREAADRIESALIRLAMLDDLEPAPSTPVFTRAVVAALDQPVGRIGSFGTGVFVGTLPMAPGADLDAVFVLGMAEGSCPAPRRDDPLVPDRDRARAEQGELVDRAGRRLDQHRWYLAALAAAPDRRVLVFPRGDLRAGRTRIPSRWLLDTASALAGTPVQTDDLDGVKIVDEVASYQQGLLDRPAASLLERDLATLAADRLARGTIDGHPLVDGDLARGLRMIEARRSSGFTEFDGNLAGEPIPVAGVAAPISATRLETWANCPFRYYLRSVLGLGDRDDPERITEIGAMDRGSLLHEILEGFIGWAITDRLGGPPQPDERWTAADRARLAEIAEHVFHHYEALGRTGRPLLWRLTQDVIALELRAFLAADEAHRVARRATPISVEMPFGLDGSDALEIELGGGQVVSFRGRADRVDRTEDGDVIVLDYKSGKPDKYRGLDGDPVAAGTTLQLGLYSEAALASGLAASGEAEARYWLVTGRGGNEMPGYRWTAERRQRFLDVLGVMAEGIGAGTFPATPGEYNFYFATNQNCRYCEFDRLCHRDRADLAAVAAGAVELDVVRRLKPDEVEP